MRKLFVLLSLTAALCALCACAPKNCAADGCEDEIYKEDYCQYHYTINTAKNELDKVGKELFDNFVNK